MLFYTLNTGCIVSVNNFINKASLIQHIMLLDEFSVLNTYNIKYFYENCMKKNNNFFVSIVLDTNIISH